LGAGNGTSYAEQYFAVRADRSNTMPIQPGQSAQLQSMQTGMWCHIAPVASAGGQLGMMCDQSSTAMAGNIVYLGNGLGYGSQPLISSGPGQPLLLGGSGARTPLMLTIKAAPVPLGGEAEPQELSTITSIACVQPNSSICRSSS
jgi:hypothetical protein